MVFWDGLLTFSIVAAAAFYLWKTMRKVPESTGCNSCHGDGCCSRQEQEDSLHKERVDR